jgi:hypothetical protein
MLSIVLPPRSSGALAAASLALLGVAGCPDAETERTTDRAEVVSREAAPVDHASVFFVGHSLVNFEMPAMTQAIAESLGATMTWDAQIRIGGALKMNWEGHTEAEGADARVAIPTGRYDTLVMTEAVSLEDMIRWMEPVRFGGLFYDLAVEARPDVRVFFYTTWDERSEVRRVFGCARPGNFRTYIDEDRPKWEGIVDEIARTRSGPPIDIVPGGEAIARAWDQSREGRIPGVPDEEPLFRDQVHLSPLGNYFIGLVQFATIFRRSPIGATTTVRNESGDVVVDVPAETARELQRIAWETVTSYPRTGVGARPAAQ